MLIHKRWQSRTALFMAVTMSATAIVPALISAPAVATKQPDIVGQLFPRSAQITIPDGTVFPVRYDKAEKIIVAPEETVPVTLTLATDVRSRSGTILIPTGSQIEGELQPADGGTRFVAKELILRNSDRRLPINATSEVITQTETINEKTNPDLLRGAAIGAAAAAVIAEIFGGIDLGEVLGGAGIGVLAEILLRRRKEVEVVVVEPETDLDLTLEEDFVFSR